MSLSPFDFFRSRFVTYLLNFPRKMHGQQYIKIKFRLHFQVSQLPHVYVATTSAVCLCSPGFFWRVHSRWWTWCLWNLFVVYKDRPTVGGRYFLFAYVCWW